MIFPVTFLINSQLFSSIVAHSTSTSMAIRWTCRLPHLLQQHKNYPYSTITTALTVKTTMESVNANDNKNECVKKSGTKVVKMSRVPEDSSGGECDKRIVYITAPSHAVASKLSHKLVMDGIVACVNIIPQVTSVYKWDGKIVEDAQEVLMIVKTTRGRLDDLMRVLDDEHPYDVPELISVPIWEGSEKYLKWISDETIIITPENK
jgi:periplasmic divalent cation tolerance protein